MENQMDKSLIGKSKELYIASLLVDAGFYVFWPFVDKGFDLVVTNAEGRKFVPIQVKYREKDPALGLDRNDAEKFDGKDVFLAFLIGNRYWFLPFAKWKEMSVDRNRGDNKLYVTISKNEEKLKPFQGDNGLSSLREVFEGKK
jgi:hypothetical protein